MLDKLYRLSIEALQDIKNISFKRLVILSGLGLFMAGVAFVTILVNAAESEAYSPFKAGNMASLLQEKTQNIDAIFQDKYSEVSKRDKELAYIYLRKKLKTDKVCFTLRKVELGENFWGIAKEYGINIDTIIGANPELEDLKARIGQEIIVLSKRGVIHEVRDRDETITLLTQLYGISEDVILSSNNMKSGRIRIGDILFIPDVKPVYMSENLKNLFNKRRMFRSPISGVYTSVFGYRIHPITGKKEFHGAVDIRAKIGTWVGAAADGKVIYTGWQGNLGYCVKIKHKNGYATLYAHLSKIYVKPGQKVFAGKLIAKTGNSGRTTGPHIHFAIYKNGRAQNPLKYLW